MNNVIKQLTSHASCRDFDAGYKIPQEILMQIIAATKQAPSWMNGQAYSMIIFDNEHNKPELVSTLKNEKNIGNMDVINSASVFVLFCVDLFKFKVLLNEDLVEDNSVEPLLIGTTDGALAIENMVVAAESFGLGTVIIGSIRQDLSTINKFINAPEYVMPIAGVAIGKPNSTNNIKPRLPNQANVFYGSYKSAEVNMQIIEKYSQILDDFAVDTGYKRDGNWIDRFTKFWKDRSYKNESTSLLKKAKILK